eukprot:6074831-Prymnesium_polylepis.1
MPKPRSRLSWPGRVTSDSDENHSCWPLRWRIDRRKPARACKDRWGGEGRVARACGVRGGGCGGRVGSSAVRQGRRRAHGRGAPRTSYSDSSCFTTKWSADRWKRACGFCRSVSVTPPFCGEPRMRN